MRRKLKNQVNTEKEMKRKDSLRSSSSGSSASISASEMSTVIVPLPNVLDIALRLIQFSVECASTCASASSISNDTNLEHK